MHDGVSLELSGRPTAVIITEDFVQEAEVQRRALGMDELLPVVIDHPLSTLSDEEIDARAGQAVAQIKGILTGSN